MNPCKFLQRFPKLDTIDTIPASKAIKIYLSPQMRCLKNHETASTFPFVFNKKTYFQRENQLYYRGIW